MNIKLSKSSVIKKYGKPYIISEIGSNHNGNLKLCKKLIKISKQSGADAVKFQMFSSQTLFSKKSFEIKGLKKKDVNKYSINIQQLKEIYNYCRKIKIDIGVTPFSIKEASLIKKNLNIDFFKIASCDCNYYDLINFIGKTKKPLILSTGLSSLKEIKKAVKTFEKTKNNKLVILHCVSNYPPKNTNNNLRRISTLNKLFRYPIGFSDHSLDIEMALASIPLGSCVIEKHFTINKKLRGWDHFMSIDDKQLKKMTFFSKNIYESLGSDRIMRVENKQMVQVFRRSIVSAHDIKKGQKISQKDLDFKRPGIGLDPDKKNLLIGKRAKKNIKFDEILYRKNFI
jgi:N-acetylneuraminate synthase